MVRQACEHVHHQLQTSACPACIVRLLKQAVLRGRTGHLPLAPQTGRHGPGAGLHHQLGYVPQGLHLHHASVLHAVELVKAHGHLVTGGGNIEPRFDESAGVIAAATDPLLALRAVAGQHNGVTPLQVRNSLMQRHIGLLVQGLGAVQVFKRGGQVHGSVGQKDCG